MFYADLASSYKASSKWKTNQNDTFNPLAPISQKGQTHSNNSSAIWRHWRRSDIFIVNFEHISHLVLVFVLLTLSR